MLSHQHGYVRRDVLDEHPHAAQLGYLVDGPYADVDDADNAAVEGREGSSARGDDGVYFLVLRIPGGPWRDTHGRSPAAGYEARWGPIPIPEGAEVRPIRPIE